MRGSNLRRTYDRNSNRFLGTGILALLTVGSFFAWRNRHQIQDYLESKGIDVPEFGSRVSRIFPTFKRSARRKIEQATDRVSDLKKYG